MSYAKSIGIVLTTFVCATALAIDAGAQSRGGHGGGGGGGGRAPSGGGSVGQAAPRGAAPQGAVVAGPRGAVVVGGPGHYPVYGYGRYPYYPYYGYRPYYGYPGFSLSFGWGYPYYGYYGYPYYYGAYPYPYPYAAPYPGYGYVVPSGATYGGIRIQGAPAHAEVYLDGNYVGVVDDYDGTFQRLEIEPGSHEVEVRGPTTLKYDVNVTPGQTVTLHANVK